MKGLLALAGAAVAAFVTGLVLFQLGMLAFVRSGAETKIPDVVGLELSAARAELGRVGFTGVVDREIHSADFGEGRIAEHRPPAGSVLRKGRKVWLTVSLGVRKTAAPSVVGMSSRQAGIVLGQEGLSAGSIARVFHATVERGAVIAQEPPAGAPCSEGARIDLLVSLGPAPESWVLPDLTGRALRDVERMLESHGLAVGERTVLIDRSVLPSTVLEQDPPPGRRIASGEEVDLVVSSRR
jgi:serine/threonine-protein kinase